MLYEIQPKRGVCPGFEPQLFPLQPLSSCQRRKLRSEGMSNQKNEQQVHGWHPGAGLPQLLCAWNWTQFPLPLLSPDTSPRWSFTAWNPAWS